ncbi:MAG: ADP-ribosylglycohydrolase family protein [Oscillospiraceae bacterium]
MNGAILGDIAGSRIEFCRPSGFDHQHAELFTGACFYTDDTVLSVATKYAVLNQIPYARAYGKVGRRYRTVGFGTLFQQWLDSHSQRGYNSYGNGAAMRVGFIGEYFKTLERVENEAEISAICTHNHEEGVKAAKATAVAVFLGKNGYSKKDLIRHLQKNYDYPLHTPLPLYRPFGKFDPTARATMPLALRCFLESDSWESCIRNVFSVKCDTDTVGCIAGGIAEAFYGTTGMQEEELLKRYLVKPDDLGIFDTFLFEWATKEF